MAAISASMLLYSRDRLPVALRVMRFLAKQREVTAILFVINGGEISATEVTQSISSEGTVLSAIHNDNIGAEFGGYQRAVNIFRDQGAEKLLLLNDTVGAHQFIDRPFLRKLVDTFAADKSGIAAGGRVVSANSTISIGGHSSQSWIQSHILALDRGALERIQNNIYLPELAKLIQVSSSVADFFGSEIGEYLKAHLTRWLFEIGQNSWYGSRPLTDESAQYLADKARAILQELSLSMRLERAGVQILNIDIYKSRDLATRARCWAWKKSRHVFL